MCNLQTSILHCLKKVGNVWCIDNIFSRPKRSQGLLYKHIRHWFINWFINWLTHPLGKISLRRRHAQNVLNGASSHKTNYLDIFSEGHINRFLGSEVAAILLNGWILPAGGVALGRVFPATYAAGLFWLVSIFFLKIRRQLVFQVQHIWSQSIAVLIGLLSIPQIIRQENLLHSRCYQ